MEKINKNIWLKYLQTYEDFNKEIPSELKVIFNKIRNIIGIKTSSFKQTIDLNDVNFIDIIIHINVNFQKINSTLPYSKKDITYYSNININDLLEEKHDINIPIEIKDVTLNIDKLISVISHEIRHIYDVHVVNEDSDMESFTKSLYYSFLKKSETNKDSKDFLFLVYLSLEHELIARNTMIYENFINCKCSREELDKLFKDSSIYESFEKLSNFDYTELLKIDDIIEKTNIFINYFGGEKLCKNDEDVLNFYKKWKNYFKTKSDEYILEANKILDDVYFVIKENKIEKPIKNIKELLLDIYNKYIK